MFYFSVHQLWYIDCWLEKNLVSFFGTQPDVISDFDVGSSSVRKLMRFDIPIFLGGDYFASPQSEHISENCTKTEHLSKYDASPYICQTTWDANLYFWQLVVYIKPRIRWFLWFPKFDPICLQFWPNKAALNVCNPISFLAKYIFQVFFLTKPHEIQNYDTW